MRSKTSGARPRGGAMTAFLAIGLVVALAAPAQAVLIDGVELTGAEGTVWDAEGDYTYGTGGGPCTGVDGAVQEEGFTPVDDGVNNFTSDLFDGGLYLMVKGNAFGDGIEDGSVSGQQLRVGPESLKGLNITRFERALQTSPTLRSLIRFNNPSNRSRTVRIVWDSALGADGEEGTRDSSSGTPTNHTPLDRWIVVSDDPISANLSDPPGLMVFFGKEAAETVTEVVYKAGDPDPANGIGEACIAVAFKITIPAHATRYMLFFTEMGQSNEDAIGQAAKYNKADLKAKLLDGIGPRKQSRILNWNLP
jgi:hypothetical protein